MLIILVWIIVDLVFPKKKKNMPVETKIKEPGKEAKEENKEEKETS